MSLIEKTIREEVAKGEYQLRAYHRRTAQAMADAGQIALKIVPIVGSGKSTFWFARKVGTPTKWDDANRRMAIGSVDSSNGFGMAFIEEQVKVRGKWVEAKKV